MVVEFELALLFLLYEHMGDEQCVEILQIAESLGYHRQKFCSDLLQFLKWSWGDAVNNETEDFIQRVHSFFRVYAEVQQVSRVFQTIPFGDFYE